MRRAVVVTGAAGFLGAHLVRRLLDDGFYVIGVDNYSTSVPAAADTLRQVYGSQFRMHQMDVTEGMPPAPAKLAAVCHLASPASPPRYQQMPVRTLLAGSAGTMNALQLARNCGARFLFTSTSEVYGDPIVHPQPETYHGNVDPVGPRSMYDEAKRFGEALTAAFAREHRLSTCIARLFNTYGPGQLPDDGRVVAQFVTQALRGEPVTLHGDGTQSRSLCYVDDTISALLDLLWSSHAGPVNVGNPDEISMRDLASLICDLCGSSSEIVSVSRPAGDPEQRCPQISLIQSLTGWLPSTTLCDGLMQTIGWFRAAQLDGPGRLAAAVVSHAAGESDLAEQDT
jgi:dTDP-glucose 4,6-dehydratase